MVNGPYEVFVERAGRIVSTPIRFVDGIHLRRIIDKIVGQVGRRVDEATPMVDARLPDGSRVNAVVHPLAIGGPFLTIRKFAVDPFTEKDLISLGTLSPQLADLVRACVLGVSTSSSVVAPARGRRRRSTSSPRTYLSRSGSSPSRTPPSSSSTRITCSAWSRARPTSRARAR